MKYTELDETAINSETAAWVLTAHCVSVPEFDLDS